MYKWSWVIFVKKSKFHDAGGPDTVVSPHLSNFLNNRTTEKSGRETKISTQCNCVAEKQIKSKIFHTSIEKKIVKILQFQFNLYPGF